MHDQVHGVFESKGIHLISTESRYRYTHVLQVLFALLGRNDNLLQHRRLGMGWYRRSGTR
jgi:hypothetical protein